jgi:ribosomal protein L11
LAKKISRIAALTLRYAEKPKERPKGYDTTTTKTTNKTKKFLAKTPFTTLARLIKSAGEGTTTTRQQQKQNNNGDVTTPQSRNYAALKL